MSNISLDPIKLIEEIENKIEKIRTRSLDLSFNELLDMYKNNELIIDPEYQRLFRWSEGNQSRFIESLLLEMPIPPIFVIEKEEGIYELIDGLQRVSSYMHFRGEHPEYTGEDEFLCLQDCDICPQLNGLTYKDLPKTLEIRLKRNFIRVDILRKESDQRLRYYMFKRLNTGGEKLSDQEIRNCTIRLLSSKFNDFIIECSKNEHFKVCIDNITEEKLNSKYDQELVLRFFAFKNYRDHYKHDVRDFLSEYMEKISDSENKDILFDFEQETIIFKKTFKVLAETLGEKSFAPVSSKNNLTSKFAIYHYEAFALAIAEYADKLTEVLTDSGKLDLFKDVLTKIKADDTFKKITTGGGKNYSGPLAQRLLLVTSKVGESLDGLFKNK